MKVTYAAVKTLPALNITKSEEPTIGGVDTSIKGFCTVLYTSLNKTPLIFSIAQFFYLKKHLHSHSAAATSAAASALSSAASSGAGSSATSGSAATSSGASSSATSGSAATSSGASSSASATSSVASSSVSSSVSGEIYCGKFVKVVHSGFQFSELFFEC